ncbi:MAG TPA: efflux RND transporter periplasmic adaptor subunit [Terriglobales bacterium]|nr:efflux RND transporter periplasmic adaptor subunit [Terriglobales bacterium]
MLRKVLRVLAIVAAIALAVGVTISARVSAIFQRQQSASQPNAAGNGRKVLYWYDAMSPQHHYNQPGKAPDGMDLVPQYAEDNLSQSASAASTSEPGDVRKILFWYDPMHPAYKSGKAGTAPDCGMQLVPKYADDEAAKMPAGTVKIAPEKQQLIGVRTATVERQSLVRTVRTTGQLTSDETKLAHVHVKVNGYIDKSYVDYIGQLVKKGQPLFTLYSPDLVATEEEYLIAKRGAKEMGASQFPDVAQGSQSLLHSTRERLKLWDISDEQIKKLDETGEVTKTLTFYSPVSGFVTDRKAFPQTAVTPDMDLYVISDLSTIWVNVDVYEYEVPFVKVGQTADMRLSYYAGRTYTGKITYIYPTVDPVSHTVKARIEFPNPNFDLKPQMLANVQLKIDYVKQIVVPQEAIMDSGDKQYLFVVHDGGVFEPRVIQMGAKLEGNVVVLSGLNAGETIVTSGNFLIDSESRLKSAMAGMQH